MEIQKNQTLTVDISQMFFNRLTLVTWPISQRMSKPSTWRNSLTCARLALSIGIPKNSSTMWTERTTQWPLPFSSRPPASGIGANPSRLRSHLELRQAIWLMVVCTPGQLLEVGDWIIFQHYCFDLLRLAELAIFLVLPPGFCFEVG